MPPRINANAPEFVQGTQLQNPLDNAGLPRKFLAFLLPFFAADNINKMQMLRMAGVRVDPSTARGYFCRYFTQLHKSGILETNKVKKTWWKGPNFWLYTAFVFQELSKHEVPRRKISSLFRTLNSVSANVICELAEHDE